MANEIRTKLDAVATFNVSLTALASNVARQSDIIVNNISRAAALIYLKIMTGAAAPSAGTVYEVYLLRSDNVTNYRTDGAGPNDANITIVNAQLIGTMGVTNSVNTVFYGDFDTGPLGPLGPAWGIAVKNSTDQALNAVEANHLKEYQLYLPEIQ